MNFNNTTPTLTPDHAREVVFTDPSGMNGYFPEISFSNLGLTGHLRTDGDVFGTYNIPYSSTGPCDTTAWMQAADSAASSSGFTDTNYESIIYVFPTNQNCPWQGQASLGGQPGRIRVNGDEWFELGIVAHEMGHNLGLYHANSYTCRDGSPTGPIVSISNFCTSNEYGDPSDVMGGASQSHFGNYHKGRSYNQSWYSPSNTQTIDPIASPSGTYIIAPIETQTSGVQALRIPRGTDSSGQPLYYYLEFRQPIGFDSTLQSTFTNGVIVRLANNYNIGNRPYLIDTTPGSFYNFYDSPLAVGQTFTDPFIGMSLTTDSISPSGASVSIQFSPVSCNRANPSVSLTPPSQTGTNGQTLTYNLSITNNDGPNCLPSLFNISSVIPSNWSISPNLSSINLAPGATFSTPVNVSSFLITGSGNYNITITARNSADSSLVGSGTAVYVVQSNIDTSPPTVTMTSPTNGQTVAIRSTITLAATASDNIGVNKVQFYLNNTFIKGCSDTSAPYSCSWKVPAQKGKTYQFSAVAFDAAGNPGYSQIITVTSQ
jgi:hypothetical protein